MKKPSVNKVLSALGYVVVWFICYLIPIGLYGALIQHYPKLISITLFPFSFVCFLIWKFTFWLSDRYKEIK
jgi:hypothetical protein